MKRKRFSAVLGCILALTMLAGLMVPVVGRASAAELEVLNPKADLEQIDNMPLADRQPLLNKLENGETVELLVIWYEKSGNAQECWATGLALKELWEEKYPDATINFSGLVDPGTTQESWDWQARGVVAPVGSPWGPKSGKNHIDGMPLKEEPFARYQDWASYDAVIFGVADCNVCTWWSSYHAKVVESLGTPVAVIAVESYENTQFYGAQDNGFSRCRRIVIDENFISAYRSVTAPGGGEYPNYSQVSGNARINAMIAFYKRQPISERLLGRVGKTVNDSTDYMKYMDLDHWTMAAKSVLEQAEWALIGPRTEADINPPPIDPVERGALSEDTLTFTGGTYEDAVWKFNKYAMDNYFGDGLPLVPPTRELVDAMLSGTERDKDDILGKLKMRGGTITVEKVAISAVMAGCKPEYMPVLVAAAEGLGNAWEEDFSWWHPMTSGAGGLSIVMLVSGPIAKEIGMSYGVGQIGSENDVNNTIGRAFRLMFRTIAHNQSPDIDTSGYGPRLSDITTYAIAENIDALPEGWVSHSEQMGFPAGSSSVTLIGTGTSSFSAGTAYNASWTTNALANLLPNTPAANSLFGYSLAVAAYSPAQARLLAETYPTKQALVDARRPSVETPEEQVTLRFPIVLGEDPGGAYAFTGTFYLATCYHVEKITGATLTDAGSDATVPSAPQNFKVTLNEETGTAYLTWDAPKSDGGSPITRYQVYYLDGGQDLAFRWLDVPGGETARSCYFTNLKPGVQYFFKVRARNEVDNARYYINTKGDGNMSTAKFSARYPVMSPELIIDRVAGKGGWACAPSVRLPGQITVLNDNDYPQLNGNPIKLYYGDASKNGADEDLYGPRSNQPE